MMDAPRSYQIAGMAALFFHLMLAVFFMNHSKHTRPVTQQAAHVHNPIDMLKAVPEKEIIKAVSVDNTEVSAMVEQLKAAHVAQVNAEQKQQQKLLAEANALKASRIQEEHKLKLLRAENARAEEKRKQAAAEAIQRQKDLEKQRLIEAKKLEALKQAQLALKQQQDAEKAQEKAHIEAANRARQAGIQAGIIDKYKALILGAISQEWILPEQVNKSLSSRFTIRLAPNGAVLNVQLTRSSGDAVLDRSAQAAIYKASPLPVPAEPGLFNLFREISLTVRPEHVRG